MTTTAVLPSSLVARSRGFEPRYVRKERFTLPRADWTIIICFLLSLTLTGLHLYPMALVSLALLVRQFMRDRYHFLVMFFLLTFSGHAFIPKEILPGLKDLLIVGGVCGMLLCRKVGEPRKAMILTLAYTGLLFLLALRSEEEMRVQLYVMREMLTIVGWTIPLLLFANRDFDVQRFFRVLLGYVLVIMAFYVLDGLILQGWVFLPGTSGYGSPSTINDLTWHPFSTWLPRKYPAALYLLMLCPYPLARYYRLKTWQWVMILLAFVAMRTMTMIFAFLLTYVVFQGIFRKVAAYALSAIVFVTMVYFVDSSTGGFLRVASTVDQFNVFNTENMDEESLKEFGSTRMAQIIPKWALLLERGELLTGMGFLDRELTTKPQFIIENDLYFDIEQSEEVATGVEVTQVQTILTAGLIGFVGQALFYLGLWWIVRSRPGSSFYLSALLAVSLAGLGGFCGLNQVSGVGILALAYGVLLLTIRPGYKKKEDLQEEPSTIDAGEAL